MPNKYMLVDSVLQFLGSMAKVQAVTVAHVIASLKGRLDIPCGLQKEYNLVKNMNQSSDAL